MVVNGKVKDI